MPGSKNNDEKPSEEKTALCACGVCYLRDIPSDQWTSQDNANFVQALMQISSMVIIRLSMPRPSQDSNQDGV